MRCLGSDNPPCARCAKAGRECIVQKPEHTKIPADLALPVRRSIHRDFSRHAGDTSNDVPEEPRTTQIWDQGYGAAVSRVFFPADKQADDRASLPSIYTTTLYKTVLSTTHSRDEDHDEQMALASKRRRLATATDLSRLPSQGGLQHDSASVTSTDPISHRDMNQLIDIFRTRMLPFIPVLDVQDIENRSYLISGKKELALCICYVAARYIPTRDRTRAKLLPSINTILQDSNFRRQTSDEKWTMLQALSVIYAYRTTVIDTADRDTSSDIPHRTIKSFIESFALHCNVHRSIVGVRSAINARDTDIASTIDFKFYMYWLWLFNMSNYFSVVAGTPPSIRIGATIRAAPQLTDRIDLGPGPRQILSEVELCILWDKLSVISTGLSEWWCPAESSSDPSRHIDLKTLQALDAAMTTAFSAWEQKWGPAIGSEPLGVGMDFHFRFTKFCLSTYLIRGLTIDPDSHDNGQLFRVNNSVQAAHHFCELLLTSGPAAQDGARYTGDFGFVMISFSCLFILEAYRLYPAVIENKNKLFETVEDVAILLKELAISSDQGPFVQGNMILRKLHEVNKHNEIETRQSNVPSAPYTFHDAGAWIMDPTWDMLNLFPVPSNHHAAAP